MTLTKADLLKPSNAEPQEFFIEALQGSIALKRLTDGQNERVKFMKMGGLSMDMDMSTEELQKAGQQNLDPMAVAQNAMKDGKMKLDLAKLQEAAYEADVQAAAWGMSVKEQWTTNEVKQLAPGAPAEIANIVYDLTDGGVSQQELDAFRTDAGVNGDNGADSSGNDFPADKRPGPAPTPISPNRSSRRGAANGSR